MQLHSTIALEIKLQYDNLGNKIELCEPSWQYCEARWSRHISYTLHVVSRGAQTIRILSRYRRVVFLVCWCHKANVTCPIQMEKWDGTVLNINDTVSRLGSTCSGFLRMHALSGCDTVSYFNGKGKVSALKVLNQNNITGLDSVLGETDASEADLMATATAFYLAIFLPEEEQYNQFCKIWHFSKAKESTSFQIPSTSSEKHGPSCPESPSPSVALEGCGQTRSTFSEHYILWVGS